MYAKRHTCNYTTAQFAGTWTSFVYQTCAVHLCLNILQVSFLPVSRVSLIYAVSAACSIRPKAATPSQQLVWWLLKKMTKFPVLFLSALVAFLCECDYMFSHLSRGKVLAECHIHPLPVSLTGCLAEYNELPVTSPSFHFSLQRQVEKPDGAFAYLLILFYFFNLSPVTQGCTQVTFCVYQRGAIFTSTETAFRSY